MDYIGIAQSLVGLGIYVILLIILYYVTKKLNMMVRSDPKYTEAYRQLLPNLLGGIVGGSAVGLVLLIATSRTPEGTMTFDPISGYLAILIATVVFVYQAVKQQSEWIKK